MAKIGVLRKTISDGWTLQHELDMEKLFTVHYPWLPN